MQVVMSVDLDTIGAALKRKLGPLPVWIWAILGGMIVYFLRSKGYFGGGLQTADTLQPRQASATPREPVTTLQPGESAYDPNTGTLTTAPGSDTGNTGDTSPASSGGGSGDYAQAIQDLADTINSALTDREQPGAAAPTKHRPSALARAKAAVQHGKVGKVNTKRLKAAGYTQRQIDYHIKQRTALGKPAHSQPHDSNSTTHKTTHTSKPRSKAHTKPANGGRQTGHSKPAGRQGKSRTPTATTHSTTRQRPKVPLTRHAAPVHHPTSTHSAKPHQQEHKSTPAPPRASAPPPRGQRAPAPQPRPKPKPKRH